MCLQMCWTFIQLEYIYIYLYQHVSTCQLDLKKTLYKVTRESFLWYHWTLDAEKAWQENYCKEYGERSCEDTEKLILMEANDNHEEEHTVPRWLQMLEPGGEKLINIPSF